MKAFYESEYIIISKEGNDFLIRSIKPGITVNALNEILYELPEIKITEFLSIKNLISGKITGPVKFGESKPRILIETSVDKFKAYLTLNVEEEDLLSHNKDGLLKEIKSALKENGINYGILVDDIANKNLLCIGRQILVAEGLRPQNGENSIVKRFVFHEAKPRIDENKKVDFYELDLINRIKEKEYLCEWSSPTEGTAGMTVKGEEVVAVPGKNTPILYDKTSIFEETIDKITKLYSMKDGAVEIKDGVLSVRSNMEIDRVDFETGNIDFDGYVTIKESIEDSFSVRATKDIEILATKGLGSVKEIVSTEGNIFIRGGVYGKGKTSIIAKKNIYIKFAKDVTIYCEGIVNIGSYAFNCNIIASQVVVESSGGQIMGGRISVSTKVSCPNIGTPNEIQTSLIFSGIIRTELIYKTEKLIKDIENIKIMITKWEKDLAAFSGMGKMSPEESKKLSIIKTSLIQDRKNLKEMEEEKRQIQEALKVRGECELNYSKRLYPNTLIQMKDVSLKISEAMGPGSLYFDGIEIKMI